MFFIPFPPSRVLPRWMLFTRQSYADHAHEASTRRNERETIQQFEVFFLRYERQIVAYLFKMTGDSYQASDLTQETFVQAWHHFETLRDPPSARAWLYRVATHLALRGLKQRRAHPTETLDDEWMGKSDPGRHISERAQVQQTLLTLSAQQRSVLVLYEVHGFSCKEIGHLLSISANAAKMALSRAREAFRKHYLMEDNA